MIKDGGIVSKKENNDPVEKAAHSAGWNVGKCLLKVMKTQAKELDPVSSCAPKELLKQTETSLDRELY